MAAVLMSWVALECWVHPMAYMIVPALPGAPVRAKASATRRNSAFGVPQTRSTISGV